jgi:hypothetical protein
MKKGRLPNKDFWRILRENGGIYSRTARYIKEVYDIDYTRQAVRQRAEKDMEQLEDVLAEVFEKAEGGLLDMIETGTPNIKIKAIEILYKFKGAKYGYTQQTKAEVTGANGLPLMSPQLLTEEEARELIDNTKKEIGQGQEI